MRKYGLIGGICADTGDLEKKICARIESLGRKKICASGSIFLGGEEFVLGWELGWDLS